MDGQPAVLGARSFDLLLCLIEHRERVVGKDELLALVWPDLVVEENNLTVQISALRKLFGANAITAVAGRGYRFIQPGLEIQELGVPTAPERRKAVTLPDDNLALPDKPSIAVLPFANVSDEAELAHFTDGLTEDITTELSRFRSLFVISRNSAFTFKNRPADVRTVARELGVR